MSFSKKRFIGLFTPSLLTIFLFFSVTGSALSQGYKNVWKEYALKDIDQRSDWSGNFQSGKVAFYKLDINGFSQEVQAAPAETPGDVRVSSRSRVHADIPMPDGTFKTFRIVLSPVMETELYMKYPNIKSYKGVNVDNPREIIRFDLGPYGFHALIMTDRGMVQVDPFNREEPDYYVSYYTDDYESDTYEGIQLCGVEHEDEAKATKRTFGMQRFDHEPLLMRQYRLAMACTPSWAASRGTVEKCLADMNTMVNRANVIYEKELAVRMVLIAKNDQIIFLDPNNNPYTNTEQGRVLIGQNTQVLNQRIGSPAYDIGHVLSRCFDVGGIASLGSICSQGKGAGVTCHNNNNLESIVTRVLSHEMGHQMSASHTFSSCGQTDQLSLGTAFEPGSGTTIMSYAGGCGSDNVTGNNDDYYHVGSLDQMLSYTNWVNQDAYLCAQKIDIQNTIPAVSIPRTGGFTIPVSTPFELTGQAFDLEDDPMTYVWEQYDAGGPSPYGSPTGNVPIFRSLRPNSKITRFFPNESRILANRLAEKDELLPTYSRQLTFRFVVRDNNPLGGAANWEQIRFFVSDEAGPFKMIYPFFDEKFEVGQKIKVEWDVANTNLPPVNCKKVHVYLSLNDALETGSPNLIPLALNVDNDGEELVILPNYVSNKARIVVKAADNIFLTTGIFPSVINPASKPSFFMQVLDNQRDVCLPASLAFEFETEALGGLTESLQFEVAGGLPQNAVGTFDKTFITGGEKNTLLLDLQNVKGSGQYEITVRCFVPGIDTLERKLYINLTGTDLDYTNLVQPENGITGAAQIQNYRWNPKLDAVNYQFQLATNPDFSQGSVILEREVKDTFFNSPLILDRSTVFYWRTRANNHCRNGEWSETYAFNTEVSSCFTVNSGPLSVNISGSGLPKVEGSLFVAQDNIITDLNVKRVRGDHERVGDIAAYLISPSNTELLLWSKKCGTSKGFNVGFDDQSIEFFKCPINTGKIYEPDAKLEVFNGESSKGVWKIRIEDLVPGEGGRFHEFELEMCTNVTLSPPVLVNNNSLTLERLTTKGLETNLLLAEDANTAAGSLLFTLVKKPVYGELLKNNVVMEVGQTFTQADINTGVMSYRHTWGFETLDEFLFTVVDGEGGWIPITRFSVTIDQSTATNDVGNARDITIYPNPGKDVITIKVENPSLAGETGRFTILDVHGREIFSFEATGSLPLDISTIKSGMYILQARIGNKMYSKKLIKQ